MSQPTYTLILKAMPSPVPPIVRLRRALKMLLRGYGLRVVSMIEPTSHTPTTPRRPVASKQTRPPKDHPNVE
jgi:hypothetical protein